MNIFRKLWARWFKKQHGYVPVNGSRVALSDADFEKHRQVMGKPIQCFSMLKPISWEGVRKAKDEHNRSMWENIDRLDPDKVLSYAVNDDEPDLIQAALARGANPDYIDEVDDRPLVFTCWPNCLQLLIEAGANVRVTCDGMSPVQHLVEDYWDSDVSDKKMFGPSMAECLRLLAHAGADMSLPEHAWPPPFAEVLAELQREAMEADTAQALGASKRPGRL